MAGDLKVVASSDLKGLGDAEGPPVAYQWSPPNPLPRLVPWLAVLVLLALKPNRTGKAWWIWLPVACLAAADAAVHAMLGFIGSEVLDVFGNVFGALGFGIAAVWLLGTYLRHRLRFLAFLRMLAAAAATSAICYLARVDWQERKLALGFLIYVGVCVLVAVIGLNLAALVCRRRYRPVALTMWLVGFVATLWLLIYAPFLVIAVISQGAPGGEFAGIVASFIALTVGTILPFLILAFANGFFRARLKELLHLRPLDAPPLPGAPPPVLTPENPI